MSRKKSKSVREARMIKSRTRRAKETTEYINRFGIHPKTAERMAPSHVADMMAAAEKKIAKQVLDYAKFGQLLKDAKLLSIVIGDFEYSNVGAASTEGLKEYEEELVKVLKSVEGEEIPENILDDLARTHLQASIDKGLLLPTPTRPGTVPKVRKMKSGKVVVMQRGDLDYEYMLEKFGIE